MPHRLHPSGTVLHVGCGPQRIDSTPFGVLDWQEIRLDINPAVSPDLTGTMTAMPAVAAASVDAIFSSHNIEHLEAHEVRVALEEFRRVLRPGGFVLITCPDLRAIAERFLSHGLTQPAYDSPAGPVSPIDMLFGHRLSLAAGNHFMAHRCGFDEPTLKATLEEGGFAQVVTMGRPHCFDLWALATLEEWPEESLGDAALALFPVLPGT
jgi:predicted SAM-dependent methyltransferase